MLGLERFTAIRQKQLQQICDDLFAVFDCLLNLVDDCSANRDGCEKIVHEAATLDQLLRSHPDEFTF